MSRSRPGGTLSGVCRKHRSRRGRCRSGKKKTTVLPATPPTLREATRWISLKGGFQGLKADGHPGTAVLWHGFQNLGRGDRDGPDLSSGGAAELARYVSAGVFKAAAGGYFVRRGWTQVGVKARRFVFID